GLLGEGGGGRGHAGGKGGAAATKLGNARRAVTSAARSLLRIHFLAGAPDFTAALGLVGATLALGELPVDATLDEVGTRFKAEDRIRQSGLSRILAIEGDDLEFHYSPSFVFAAADGLSAAFAFLSGLAACFAGLAACSAAAGCALACSAFAGAVLASGCSLG